MVDDLPTDFVRIHLSPSLQKQNSEVEFLTPTPTKKYVGGIAELGGRIYILSSPYHKYYEVQQPFFEVYDPSKNEWTSLPKPHFLLATKTRYDQGGRTLSGKLTCFVFDAKWYVSSYHC